MSPRVKRTLKYAAATDVQSSKDYMYLTEYTQLDLYIEYNSKEVHAKGTNARMSRQGSLYAHAQ